MKNIMRKRNSQHHILQANIKAGAGMYFPSTYAVKLLTTALLAVAHIHQHINSDHQSYPRRPLTIPPAHSLKLQTSDIWTNPPCQIYKTQSNIITCY